jgi:hypothetical protein
VGRVQNWRLGRALAGVMPKRDLARAELAPAWISVASAPPGEPRLPDGSYAVALVDSVLYLAGADVDGARSTHHRLRLGLAEAKLAMAFGGPPFHSTLHFEHPAVGRLVMSLDALTFATHTEAAVSRVRASGAW